MSKIESDKTMADLLREALPGADCPDPGVFLELDGLDADERARIDTHTSRCAGCSAERRLAAEFASGETTDEPADLDRADLDYVVNRLRESGPGASSAPVRSATILRHPAWQRLQPFALPLAAAAAVLLAITMFLVPGSNAPPPLPELSQSGVLRGTRIEPIAPLGRLDAVPSAFEWAAVDGARDYYIELRGVDGRVLWSVRSSDASASLPESVGASLHPAVTYYWQVEARDAGGATLKASPAQAFEIRTARDR